MMWRKKKAVQEAELEIKLAQQEKAVKRAVAEAKNTQKVIIANGFTLELLRKMGGGTRHD